MRALLTILFAVSFVVVVGCSERPISPFDADDPPGASVWTLGVTPTNKVDFLFVIDGTGSTQDQQNFLVRAFPKLRDILRAGWGGALPDLRIGVINVDLGAGDYKLPSCEVAGGDGARLLNRPWRAGCRPPKDPWISHKNGRTNIVGATGTAADQVNEAFKCIAYTGTSGCGFEQTLEAMHRALDPTRKVNPGFLRADALLVVLILTEEDDCSAARDTLFDPKDQSLASELGPLTSFRCFEHGFRCAESAGLRVSGKKTGCVPAKTWLHPIARYTKLLRDLRAPGRLLVRAIAGATDRVEVGRDGNNPVLRPSCQSSLGFAVPGLRIEAFVRSLRHDARFSSICDADFAVPLQTLGRRSVARMKGLACLPAPVLSRAGALVCTRGEPVGKRKCPSTSLKHAHCTVTDVVRRADGQRARVRLPRCPTSMFSTPRESAAKACATAPERCPCWRLVRNGKWCNAVALGSPNAVEIIRTGLATEPHHIEVRCRAAPFAWSSEKLEALPFHTP